MYFRRKTGLRARLGLFCLTAFLRAAKVIANQSGARANAADADRARQKGGCHGFGRPRRREFTKL